MLREHFEHAVKTSGLTGACTGFQENHPRPCGPECHCGLGTPGGVEIAEVVNGKRTMLGGNVWSTGDRKIRSLWPASLLTAPFTLPQGPTPSTPAQPR